MPDFYPEWLAGFRHRKIWASGYGCLVGDKPIFAKPGIAYKLEPARVFSCGEYVPSDWACSEVVTFLNEWRYYVADRELLAAGWYDGHDDDEPAPKLDIAWPRGWCGAADFGRLDTGEIAVVECHHPFACGNYLEADECEAWVMWLELGWQWTLKDKLGVSGSEV